MHDQKGLGLAESVIPQLVIKNYIFDLISSLLVAISTTQRVRSSTAAANKHFFWPITGIVHS